MAKSRDMSSKKYQRNILGNARGAELRCHLIMAFTVVQVDEIRRIIQQIIRLDSPNSGTESPNYWHKRKALSPIGRIS